MQFTHKILNSFVQSKVGLLRDRDIYLGILLSKTFWIVVTKIYHERLRSGVICITGKQRRRHF